METSIVFLGQKGEIRQGKLKTVTPQSIMTALKKKEAPSLIGTYTWKQRFLQLYGYIDGKESNENQHHLPAPLEGMTFYGDILVLACTQANLLTSAISLKTSEYEIFYTARLEGDEEDEEDMEGDVVPDVQPDSDDDGDADGHDVEDADDAVAAEADGDAEADADEDEEVEEIKPVRVARVRKAAIVPIEYPELDPLEPASNIPLRVKVQSILASTIPLLTTEQRTELEEILFQNVLKTADKQEIRKAWNFQGFRDIYLGTARRIIGNLDPTSYVKNTHVWERFTNGELTLAQIVNQNYYELCPENWQVMVDRRAKRERIQLEGDFSRATDKWLCNGCKMRKCTYYELQTRSADEPMTIFIQCLNCGKRWTH